MNLSKNSQRVLGYGVAALVVLLVLSGCKGITQPGERAAREQISTVREAYRPNDQRPALPPLTTHSPLRDFITYAIFNHPQVEANYDDWAASVERITIERSLPDPKLTFEAYIGGTITSLMPGLMADIPGPGKLSARASVAAAASEGKYFRFEASVLQTAFDLKKSYYQLYFLNEKIRVNQQTLQLLTSLEQIARAQNEVGKSTLQDVLRAQIEKEKLGNEIGNLEDSRRSLMAQFKGALGMTRTNPDPPLPADFISTPLDFTDEQLFTTAMARNSQIKSMEAEVRRADASLRLAHKERVPDFSAGGEVDVKAAPVVWNPQLSMTLPIWRDKIAAEIAEAQASKRGAEARLSAQQISLAVDFAEKTYLYREANRNLKLLQERLLPRARQSLEVARAAYLSGQLDFLNVIDAERTLFQFQLEHVDAQTQRELALAELSLLIAGLPPAGAPILEPQSPKYSDLPP
jgi:cobalt-zinc-cadmium efflux system outer membrane protein